MKILKILSIIVGLFFSQKIYAEDANNFINDAIVENDKPVLSISFFPKFSEENGNFLKIEKELINGRELTVTGIILFSGNDIISKQIKRKTNSPYSHCGLKLTDVKTNTHYSFESTGSKKQIIKSHILPQVQIAPLDNVVNEYEGRVVERDFRFLKSHSPDETAKIINEYLGRSYEHNFIELWRAPKRNNKQENDNSVFCSELNALCLQRLGYISDEIPANNYIPADFSEASPNISLRNAELGAEVELKPWTQKSSCCVIL